MKYGLTTIVAGSDPVEITEGEYVRARDAKATFMTLFGLEEKIDVVLENYVQYERTLLDLTLQRMLLRPYSHPNLTDDMRLINIQLLNLLSAARLYLDQVPHDLTRLYGKNSVQLSTFDQKRREVYDSSLGYRTSEALRNHIQHHSLPVTRLMHTTAGVGPKGEQRLQFGINPYIDVNELREDRTFRRSVLDELAGQGPRILLTPFLREYVSGLGSLHETVRKIAEPEAVDAHEALGMVLERGRAEFDMTDALAVVEVEDDGTFGTMHQIFEELLRLRSRLVEKNAALATISMRFVSGDVIHPAFDLG